MKQTRRRVFMLGVVGLSVLGAGAARAQAAVAETDPQAVALGYKSDTTKVDPKKWPKHDASQHCGTCQLFQGKPGDTTGGCPLFAGRVVSANGWCSAWVKKA